MTGNIDTKATKIYLEILRKNTEDYKALKVFVWMKLDWVWRQQVTKSIHFQHLKPTSGLKATKVTLGLGANVVGNCK